MCQSQAAAVGGKDQGIDLNLTNAGKQYIPFSFSHDLMTMPCSDIFVLKRFESLKFVCMQPFNECFSSVKYVLILELVSFLSLPLLCRYGSIDFESALAAAAAKEKLHGRYDPLSCRYRAKRWRKPFWHTVINVTIYDIAMFMSYGQCVVSLITLSLTLITLTLSLSMTVYSINCYERC